MSPRIEKIGRGLVVVQGNLTRVYPAGGNDEHTAYWLRDGLIGRDDPDEDLTHWYAMTAEGPKLVRTETTTDEALDLVQAVIDAGLAAAGIVDVPPRD